MASHAGQRRTVGLAPAGQAPRVYSVVPTVEQTQRLGMW